MYFLQIIVPLLSIAHAVPWDGPIPTQSPVYQDGALAKREPTDRAQGVSWSPAPMREPQDIFKAHAKRQTAVASSSKATTTSSKGPICGYVSGIGSRSIYCATTAFCMVAPAQSVWGCCRKSTGCDMATTCIAQSEMASCAMDAYCVTDDFATKCDQTEPYCNKLLLYGGGNGVATAWECDSTPSLLALSATATDGGKPTANLLYFDLTLASRSTIKTSTPIAASSTLIQPPKTSAVTIVPSTLSSTSPTPTVAPTSGSSTPVGPIVGGVIGGVALVAAISFLIWFFARRRKNDDPAPQQSSQPEAEASYFNQTSFPIAKNLSPEPTVSPVSPRDSHYQTPPYSQNPGQSGIEMYKYSQNSPHPQYTAYSPPLTSHTYPGAIEVDGVSVKRNPS